MIYEFITSILPQERLKNLIPLQKSGFFVLPNIYNYEKYCKTNRIRFNKDC
jgi:hypothetical protein